ncbi:MAG TPA: penicillin-binding protein 2 [Solirubrobacteraceae bacterium]|nr:penicillin-binding protein 2 [Solirubrobacteraceae bacterium]
MALVERRIGLLFAGFLALLCLAAGRATWLGAVKGPSLSHAAASQQVVESVVPARRGTILDDRGVELATSEPADDVSADPHLVKDPERAAASIAPILGVPEAKVLRALARRDTGFVYLARRLPADTADRIAKLDIVGVDLTPTTHRVYPRDFMASQVLGSVGIDGTGLSGLEYLWNRVLRGRDGERRVVKDALGQPISVQDIKTAQAGARLQLTLDSQIQDRVEQVLGQVGATYRPKGATAIVMDPRSGAILAMANWPRINSNAPAAAPSYANQNRAVGFDYEPGSTFKAVTVAGALEDHVVTPDTMFPIPPQIQVADRTIHDAEQHGYETLPVSQILAQSSNIGAVEIGMRMGAPSFDQWVRRFGFGRPTGIDLPGEERGLVLPLSQYSGSSMGNLPMGQGLAVTPIQIATAYSAIANGGILRPPHIVGAVDGRPVKEPAGHRIISAATAASLRSMLEGVLAEGGTASEVSIPGYHLAGKTGTAQKIDPTTGEYSSSRYVASFVGFAPAAHPKLLISVMVDEPQGAIYGGQVAAPAFGRIAQFALPYLRIPPG